MENPTNKTHLLILIFAIIISCFLCLSSSDSVSAILLSDDGDEGFSYDPCSERGPKHWGDLKEEWAMCKNGKMQSPVALSFWNARFTKVFGHQLTRNHWPANAVLKNNGHGVVVEWGGDAGSIKINDIYYNLRNYHWHHPSEHTKDGKTYPLELHMVHTNMVTGNIAVIGVLYEFGPSDPLLSLIEKDLKRLNIEGGEIWLGPVDPRLVWLRSLSDKYAGYMGSLTTPPCTEGVIWTVMERVHTVSPDQLELLKQAVVEENIARPLQDVNGRPVWYYNPLLRKSAADQ
ncbi:alpha carbonic anhydrase 4-like [Momordica charantia]|uniref:Alpha carbonic anhydrase 4-like n=1 Tax=Momordica charantia TaxID=3673 RepID=A0A6J1CSG4_MOMCH|nr:alpha carbonic anhydrase 4-like [Momordica charantia]